MLSSVFAADLDGDGDMDLASASYTTIKLHGTKTRRQRHFLEVNRSCRRVRMVLNSVFAADMDGDGDMDLASASIY